jgi:hypothetical protein
VKHRLSPPYLFFSSRIRQWIACKTCKTWTSSPRSFLAGMRFVCETWTTRLFTFFPSSTLSPWKVTHLPRIVPAKSHTTNHETPRISTLWKRENCEHQNRRPQNTAFPMSPSPPIRYFYPASNFLFAIRFADVIYYSFPANPFKINAGCTHLHRFPPPTESSYRRRLHDPRE